MEGIYARLDQARCDYVEKEEKSIKFGSGEQWEDLDADEVDLRKKTEPPASPSVKSTSWEQWGGIVERGAPETLVLTRLKPCRTKAHALGPGPMRKRDWAPTVSNYFKGCSVVLHTNGARAYKMKVDGAIHDNVCHSNKRIGHGGRSGWNKPAFVGAARQSGHPDHRQVLAPLAFAPGGPHRRGRVCDSEAPRAVRAMDLLAQGG